MNDISQNLNLKQSQNLVMTPQMQQAVKLLQLNNVELTEYIEEELEKNPLLEKDDGRQSAEQDAVDIGGDHDSGKDSDAPDNTQGDMDGNWDDSDAGGDAEPYDTSDDESLTIGANVGAGGSTSFADGDYSFENTMSKEETLRDHLIDQLHLAFSDPRDHMIGTLLIDRLDESGYLREDANELAEKLSCDVDRIHKLLDEMKRFDPTGIFASGLSESLALQLEENGNLDAPMQALLDNIELLAAHDHDKLAKICDVNMTYLQDMIEEIRRLNPKPAAEFDHFVMQTAIPDVLMKRLPKNLGGGWRVELNHETLPKVLVNQDYVTQISTHAKDKKDKDYLNQQLQSANWLVKMLDQRAKTILKVAGEIIEQQDAFFLFGIEFLRPLTLKDIADEIDMHESTVSRVTTGKFIETPRGLFELKYFFSSALGDGDNTHSSESVKARIKALVDAEDPKKTLSDDKIAEALTDEGIDIARRTVAKYREAMNIPSSVQRRRIKKNQQS
ncbi:MAG: RNA polymerase factor sigma-54 [Alphaproteobacteria bacterium]|jgi:RNA polymerase sigma-54 factor|nr:RNA polymerase factor sigma-54 [Alphaproteobacteria bacterium]MDP7222219.1 RNA polymerase factor sigma-54 [Alphaproteobacteria bacterium]